MKPSSGPSALDEAARRDTALHLETAQLESGMIPLVVGGGTDPWNHIEAAIALDLSGHHEAARRAFAWLASIQRSDGAWYGAYGPDGSVASTHVDTNTVGYFATGLFAHRLIAGSARSAVEFMPVLERSLDFICRAESSSGKMPWSVENDGVASPYSLVTGSSSLVSSLRHGAALANSLGLDRSHWMWAAERVAAGVRDRHEGFLDKSEFAMDWYYPVLSGVVVGAEARHRFLAGMAHFVTEDGVLCRSDRRWVTSAETAEAAIAACRVGEFEIGERLFLTLTDKRRSSGGYLTGLVYPERSEFPAGEETTYSSAAVLIAADVLAGGVAAELFGARTRVLDRSYERAMSTRRLSVGDDESSLKHPDEIAS
jgi:hypothetical protein